MCPHREIGLHLPHLAIRLAVGKQHQPRRHTMYSIGQRVGIVSGLQAVGGPVVTQYGTVTAVEEFWVGVPKYQVTPDDDGEALWYRDYLLRSVAEPTPVGPVCAACGDATCVADDAHHKVTGEPTTYVPGIGYVPATVVAGAHAAYDALPVVPTNVAPFFEGAHR